ncbi:hypothetical protein [Kitasatospora sp. NPDC059571]|uniref:hypothetical protein n=1 Tax=Kitasatospora sp. NPDC059571 TaxID=3346871 RepID=UPI0036992715
MRALRSGRTAALLAAVLVLAGCASGADGSADTETGAGTYRAPDKLCRGMDLGAFKDAFGTPEKPGEEHVGEGTDPRIMICSISLPGTDPLVDLDVFASFRTSVEATRTAFQDERAKLSASPLPSWQDPVSEIRPVQRVGSTAYRYLETPNDHVLRTVLETRRSNLNLTVRIQETGYSMPPDRSGSHRAAVDKAMAAFAVAELAALAK